MTPFIYNIENHYKGDTFRGVEFTIKNTITNEAVDLSNVSVRCMFRGQNKNVVKELSIGSGLTLVDAVNGIIKIDSLKIDWYSGIYDYDIEFTFLNGDVKTYVKGNILIEQDVTYG